MSLSASNKEKLDAIYFEAIKGSIYHSLRSNFLQTWHRIFMVSVIIASSSSLIDFLTDAFVLNGEKWVSSLFPLLALVASALDIVFAMTIQASRHEVLCRRWNDLIEKIEREKELEDKAKNANYQLLVVEKHNIEKDEPAIYIGLDAVAYNAASRGYNYREIYHIPKIIYYTKNLFKFPNTILDGKPNPNYRTDAEDDVPHPEKPKVKKPNNHKKAKPRGK